MKYCFNANILSPKWEIVFTPLPLPLLFLKKKTSSKPPSEWMQRHQTI